MPSELGSLNDDCMICLDTINLEKHYIDYDIVFLECNHVYHYQCLLTWIIDSKQAYRHKIKCPLCNQNVAIITSYHNCLKKKYTHAILDIIINKSKIKEKQNPIEKPNPIDN